MPVPLRLGIVGSGAIAHAYALAAPAVEEVEVAYVADVRPESAHALAEVTGGMPVVDPLVLADPHRVDLVLLCTPPSTHEGLATAFLRAGVPVMCEKPLAPEIDSARRILSVADSTATPLTMASKFRFAADVVDARSMVQAGMLGEVIRVDVAFAARVDMRQRWNSDPHVSGGGVIIDNGTHAADVVRYLLGPVDEVLAASTSTLPELAVEDTASLLLRTTSGHIGTIDLSWGLDRMTDRYLVVMGTEGSLEVGWRASRARLASSAADLPFGHGYDKLQALGANLRNVALAILGKEDFVVTPADAVASVAVVDAAYESVRTGRWVSVRSRKQER